MNKQKKKETKKSSQTITLKGQLDISKGGLGFVIVEGMDKDVLVRPNDFNRALHGDTVKVQVKKDNNGKRTEGVVTEVLERKQSTFIGNMQVKNNVAFFIPASDKPVPDFYVQWEKLNGAKDGQRVVVRLVKWDKTDRKPEGEVVSILQASDVNDIQSWQHHPLQKNE